MIDFFSCGCKKSKMQPQETITIIFPFLGLIQNESPQYWLQQSKKMLLQKIKMQSHEFRIQNPGACIIKELQNTVGAEKTPN